MGLGMGPDRPAPASPGRHCIRETHDALAALGCTDQDVPSAALQFLKSIAVECEEVWALPR